MKQVLVKQGSIVLEDVPAPSAEPGQILVQVAFSCISAGTELSGIRSSGVPLWKRAIKQPQNVRKALNLIATKGVGAASSQISNQLKAALPTGYSAAGTVVGVGAGVADLQVGDRVACAGAQCAFHAEYIAVPRNLAVAIDDRLGLDQASTVTLGAIALQGVRRAAPTLGECFVVVGLGILGQLTAQLLRANGCRVIGVDLDPARVSLARAQGMDASLDPAGGADVEQIGRLTDGIGADGVIITAATSSDEVMSSAFKFCRKKGRVVLVGDVGLNLNRADFYQKELDFFISASYGPGRYDERYEEGGLDYPVGYVRWTENRNMGEYLRLIADGRIDIAPLVSAVFPIDRAVEAYGAFSAGNTDKPLIALLSYPKTAPPQRTLALSPRLDASSRAVRLAVVGAGGFAKAVHLPNIRSLPEKFELATVVSRTGHNALAVARQFGAANAGTDFGEVLADPAIDAVIIATRHDLHADMALEALAAGKHVLLEKPLALSADEVARIARFYEGDAPKPVLLTGFNRRFSPHARLVKQVASAAAGPMIISYRMNAGHIPLDHWVHGPEGGGRNLGEACHIYDLFTYLTGSRVISIAAKSLAPASGYYARNDNFIATMSFEDGSVASLTYTAMGAKSLPKERLEIAVHGTTIVLDDYRGVDVLGPRQTSLKTKGMEKGQREEIEAFADALINNGAWPIPLWEQVQATEIALEIERLLTAG